MKNTNKDKKIKLQQKTFDQYMVDALHSLDEAKSFLEVSISEYEKDGDTKSFLHALRLVAEAQGGILNLAEKTHLNRQNLYKILTGKTTPRFDTTIAIIKGLGFKFSIEDRSNNAKHSY
jgi:probable addiction module antidote protein